VRPLLCLMSFIGTCVKRDSTSKLTSRSVGCRIFCIFCMKSVKLVMYDSEFSVRSIVFMLRNRISCMSGSV